uniref:Uncharacterized protein n=1 Tax=Pavo cristatus TaxID=9049 RepID=A0A8C9FLY3_PAVCR
MSSLINERGADAEQDAAVKLAQERAEIVAKYDRGRDGAQIEPWEDADYRLYKVTDRFGFLQFSRQKIIVYSEYEIKGPEPSN